MSERNTLKWILIAIVEMEMLLFSGMIYGINSLFPTLIDLNYFCSSKNNSEPCPNQKISLGYIYITIVVSTSLFSIPIGVIMDNFGATITKILCTITSLLGLLLFALSSIIYQYLIFLACILLGFFTYACMMGNFALTSIFPEHQSLIISLFSCSFDFSCIVMTFIVLVHKQGISLLWCFVSMAIICALLCTSSAILNKVIEVRHNNNDIINDNTNDRDELIQEFLEKNSDAYLEKKVADRYPTLKSALTSRFYIVHVVNLSILSFFLNFFFSELIIHLPLLFPGNAPLVSELLVNSNYILALGLLMSPFPGLLFDLCKRRNSKTLLDCEENEVYRQYLKSFTSSFVICGITGQLMFVLLLINHKESIYASFALVMILRVTLFSTNSIYLLNAFPKCFFGQLLGIGFFISGIFSFIQYGIIFPDNQRLLIVNYSIIALGFVSYVHPILLNVKLPSDTADIVVDESSSVQM